MWIRIRTGPQILPFVLSLLQSIMLVNGKITTQLKRSAHHSHPARPLNKRLHVPPRIGGKLYILELTAKRKYQSTHTWEMWTAEQEETHIGKWYIRQKMHALKLLKMQSRGSRLRMWR